MALYPSLEDMKIDQMMRAQTQNMVSAQNSAEEYPNSGHSAMSASNNAIMYPTLNDYMGLELSESVIAQNMPEYLQVALPAPSAMTTIPTGLIAPLSGQSVGLQKAHVSHGIRELVLCKDAGGKIGLRVKAINKGIFVCLVATNSPAALAGLRFGDQILQINNISIAGYSMDKVHELFRKSPVNGISVVVRDRPFERTITLHKDSTGTVGFDFKNGKITGLVKDSSAARNGVLTEHNLLEINGQNVVGLKDKEIRRIIEGGGQVITITVIPTYVFDHIVKSMSSSLLKGAMDHSVPSI
ncbi:X11Lbeta [Carabus blaptoides fortunei]